MTVPTDNHSEENSAPNGISPREISLRRDNGPLGREALVDQVSAPRIHLNHKSPEKADFDLLKHIRLSLRGRLLWVIGLGILTGALGGYAGWKLGHPMYTSAGLVRIAYELPKVLTETDQNGPMQMFDTFMQSQRLLITSRHVLDIAVLDPIWHTTGVDVPADPDTYFREHLIVTISPRSEYIQIAVSDRDPRMAAAAANSVMNAYQQIYDRQERSLEDARMGALGEKSGPLEEKKHTLNDQINADSAEFGSSDLSSFYDSAAQRTSKTAAALDDIRTAIALAPQTPAGSDPTPASQPAIMEVEQIAAVDPVMRGYVTEQEHWEDELTRLHKHYGDKSQPIILAQESLEAAKNHVTKYAELFREFHVATAQNLGDPGRTPVMTAGRSLDSLRDSETRLDKILQQEKVEMVRLGDKRMELDRLRHDLNATQESLDQVLHRTDALRAEDTMGGRLSITSTGEIPLGPETDPRIKLAAVGGLAGAALPAIALILVALLLPGKFRYADEAERSIAGGFPLLGILPVLDTSGTAAGDEMSSAAHSIHQIRVTLRAQAPHDRSSNLYLITSAGAGDGKTSLAMSLALSFAATHQRTLLIDCDLVGRQLTSSLQSRDMPGLFEAMAQGTFRKLIRKPSRNLYFLPTGQVGMQEAWSLNAKKLRPLLAQARRHFDVIIIDTGPILGSVEAAILAQEVDGVLFMVARNQRRALIERAVRRLVSLDAHMEGMIFNRARSGDFESSMYGSSSVRSTAAVGSPPARIAAAPAASQHLVGFGPLVQAMVSTVPEDAARLAAATAPS